MSAPSNTTAAARRGAAARLWLLNLAAASIVGLAYLEHAPVRSTAAAFAFAHLALISTLAILSLAPGVVSLLAASSPRLRRTIGVVLALGWTLFVLLVWADTRVYALFRYHFNGMVWNLLTTPGGEDAFQLGPKELAAPLLLGAAWFVLLLWLYRRWSARSAAVPRFRTAWLAGGLLAFVVLADKGLYARADLERDRRITVYSRVFPLYLPLTVKNLARKRFGVKLAERPAVELAGEALLLHYPLAEPRFAPAAQRPNLLIVVVDSLRADALGPETTPALARFAAGARVFENHASGGNATRFGIFSLVYGVHGSYWHAFEAEHTPPVLVTALAKQGYDLRVFSAASMSYPEFRSTAWVTMEDRVEDRFPQKQAWQRDVALADRFGEWLGEREASGAKQPFFAFVLLDSPHQRYSYDPDQALFQPSEGELDYVALSGATDPALRARVENRYKNAVLHADRQLGRILADLERTGELARTVVAVTGDHGEEFWEHGYYGHTSNFTPEQVRVAFVMGGPGVPPGVETRPTSHLDVAPTFLELAGADPAQRADWTLGANLLDPPAQRTRAIGGWNEMALWVDGGVIWIPLEGYKGLPEAYGYDWQPLADGDALIGENGRELAELARECRRFLR